MPNQALSFGLLFGGGILLTKAVTGSSFSDIVKGQPGSVSSTGQNLASGGVSGVGKTVAGAAGKIPAASGGGTVIGDVTQGDLNTIASQHGWNATEVDAWAEVIKLESNGTITDTNPSSGAYGIAQGITGPSWYAAHGGSADSVMGQLTAMANYIAQRYGSPTKALSFHLANNWY